MQPFRYNPSGIAPVQGIDYSQMPQNTQQNNTGGDIGRLLKGVMSLFAGGTPGEGFGGEGGMGGVDPANFSLMNGQEVQSGSSDSPVFSLINGTGEDLSTKPEKEKSFMDIFRDLFLGGLK